MPYIINRYNGNQLLILDDGILDSTSIPLGLVGRNYTGWGEVFNENFVFLLENFYNSSPPARPMSGQIWYDSSGDVLKSYNGEEWLAIGNSNVSENEPTHSRGGLWLKTTTNQLYVSDGTTWRLIGPEAVEGYGVTKISSIKLLGTDGTYHPVIKKEIDDVVVEIWSDDDFTIDSSEAVSGFNRLYPGSNLSGAVETVNIPTGNLKIIFPSVSRLDNKTLYPYISSENYIEYRGENETLEVVLLKQFANGYWELRDLLATDPQPSVYYSKFNVESPLNIQDWYAISLDIAAPDTLSNPKIIGPILTGENLQREILNSRYNFRGNLKGNADTATAFFIPRTINGTIFDGTTDISIKARTPKLLISGDYIVGENWDGGFDQTWSVNASPQNRIGTVVARDSNGSFSAESITSNRFVGDLEGNVTALGGLSTFNEINASLIRAELIGNAASSTKLQIPRTINTIPFDGTQNITLPVPANTLTTDTLAPNVLNSSLINLGKLESLQIEAPGLRIGDGNDLRIFIEGFTPIIRSDVNNVIGLQLLSGSSNTNQTDLRFISAASAATFGVTGPALVPDLTTSPADANRIHLGLPSKPFRHVYSSLFTGTSLNISSINGPSNTITIQGNAVVEGAVVGDLVGNVTGNVTGNLVGNVTGASSLNMLKSGDTMTGDLSWTSSGRGLDWSVDTDGASIRFYSLGEGDPNSRLEFNTFNNATEYFLWTHTLESGSKFDLMKLLPNDNFGNVKLSVYGLLETTNTITAPNFSGSGANLTSLNASNLASGTVPTSRLSGTYNISISGSANTAASATVAGTATNLSGGSVSATSGTFSQALIVASGPTRGIRFPNDAFGGSGDTATITLETTGGEDTKMTFRITNDPNDEFRFIVPSVNGVKINGHTVVNAGNVTDYLPTKEGVGAVGTWPININGNAATVSNITSTQIISALGFTPLSSAQNQPGGPITGTSGTFSDVLNIAAGSTKGIRFPNDAFGGGSDTATITLETSGGEATKMTFRMTNDADDQFRFIAPSDNGITMNGHIMIHAGNYNSYAPTRTGGGASGTWPINITGNASTVSSLTSSQIINALGYTPLASVSSAQNQPGQPIFTGAGISSGLRFPNDPYGGSGDLATITYESVGGERTRLRFRVTNDASASVRDEAEFLVPDINGLLVNDNIVLNAGNYNNYAPTRTGGGASGTWPINITGNAATVSSLNYTQVVNALGFVPASNPPSALSGTVASLLVDSSGSAEIRFNSRGDSNQDLAISVQGENFIIYEPDDGNREWFRIDDTGSTGSASVYGQKIYDHNNITYTYGQTSAVGFTNQVGSFNNNSNYFDVYPPAGYSMSGLLAFIPSIHVIHFAGGVNADDSLRCQYSVLSNRIRVYVQNTEQRSTPAGNWLAIWRR